MVSAYIKSVKFACHVCYPVSRVKLVFHSCCHPGNSVFTVTSCYLRSFRCFWCYWLTLIFHCSVQGNNGFPTLNHVLRSKTSVRISHHNFSSLNCTDCFLAPN